MGKELLLYVLIVLKDIPTVMYVRTARLAVHFARTAFVNALIVQQVTQDAITVIWDINRAVIARMVLKPLCHEMVLRKSAK